MKNKILLCALLSLNVITQPVTTDAESANAITKATMDIAITYYNIIKKCLEFINCESDNKAPLLKTLAIATELLPKIKAFAKSEAKTEEAHEALHEYEQKIEPYIKAMISNLQNLVTNPNISNEQLREVLNSYVEMIPQMIKGGAKSIAD